MSNVDSTTQNSPPKVPKSIKIHPEDKTKRRFLVASLTTVSGVAVGALVGPVIETMYPTAAQKALSMTIIDLAPIEPGMQFVAMWQGKPVIVINRTKGMLKQVIDAEKKNLLKDPDCKVPQQPPYCKAPYRSRIPEWYVGIKICNHLCCVPHYRPKAHSVTPWWPGGFHCPCHGSMYDLSARVIKGSPAPHNMAIPEYDIDTKTMKVTVTKWYPPAQLC